MNTRELFYQHIAQTSPAPIGINISHGKGVYLYDDNHKAYIDFIAGISVSSLGHCHPVVRKAIAKQAKKYLHVMVYGEYIQSPQVELATYLAKYLPPNLSSVYFVNSGSEANEGAMKLAKRYTGRTEIISCHNAYHGSTHGALSIMGGEYFKQAYRPLLPDIKHIRFNKEEDLEKITTKTAAIFIETIQGEAGAVVPTHDYLRKVRERCTQVGALMVSDEIQTGIGRTGTRWAFEQYGIVPDILCTAKAFGAGLPLGAFISSKEIMDTLMDNPVLGHITTFGGNAVCCAASLAQLKYLEEENIYDTIFDKEKLIRKYLKHPSIKEIRGRGLLLAIELQSTAQNMQVIRLCLAKGLLTDWFLFCDNALRVAPPLIITKKEIKKACAIIIEAIQESIKT